VHLAKRIAEADLIVTGEGRLDDQTLDGKGPAGVAAMAREAGRRVIAFGGSVAWHLERAGLFDAIIPLADRPLPLDEAMREAATLLEHASFRAARLIGLGR
jgi:glycerate kinase